MKNNYVDFTYDEKIRPHTGYPVLLCRYLVKRYGLTKGTMILDVGCGRGDFLSGFKDAELEVAGLNAEEPASGALKGFDVKYCDIEKDNFPFESESFDAVFSKSVIEHLHDPENFILECKRVLKPGGRIIIMTPDWISQMKIFFHDYTHRQPYTATAVNDLLGMFGYKNVSAYRFYQLPVIWRYPALRVLSGILRLLIPVTISVKSKIKFVRWSCELMVLGTGVK